MRRLLVTALAIGTLLGAVVRAGADPKPGDMLTPAGDKLAETSVMEMLKQADVVVLGEVHDNPVHHENQARIVKALAPGGLVAEMIKKADEAKIRAFLADGGTADGIGAAIGWEKSGWPDWSLYAPIFRALPPEVAIAGAGMPRDQVRRVMAEPAHEVIPDARLKPVLQEKLDPILQAGLEREMIDAHCGELPIDMAPMMVEVQRLRDAALSAAVLRLVDAGHRPVVVITGNGHARTDRAVPAMLGLAAPDLFVVSVGQFEEDDASEPSTLPFDVIWVTPRHDRPDPCEELRKRKK